MRERDPRAAVRFVALIGALAGCESSPAAHAPDAPLDGGAVPPDAAGDETISDGGTEPPGPPPHVLYPIDRRHSPITPEIVDRLTALAAASTGKPLVFAKIGDSLTRSTEFLHCFDGGTVDLADRVALGSTITYYLSGVAGATSPFARTSLASFNGATAETMLGTDPPRLDPELAAIDPLLGIVMLGTNDVRRGRPLEAFARDLWTNSDRMLAAGTIPLFSTIPPNTGDPWADVQIPRVNLAIRGLAQGLQVPVVDLHRALGALPNRGISSDGVHLSIDPGGSCRWTASGLQYGYSMRNLVTIEQLHRVRAALAGTAGDPSADLRPGTGRAADPYRVPWPYADLGDVRTGEAAVSDHGCPGGRPLSGKELVYELTLPTQIRLHAQVITRDATDVDILVIAGGTCRAWGDDAVIVTVGPGTVQIVVDTPVAGSEGEFLLVVGPRANPPS
jgi:lysophospholipase L1-like esterase